MILDMSQALNTLEQEATIKKVTTTSSDFVETEIVIVREQWCVIQVADKDKLNSDTIDYSNAYLMVHSSGPLENGELIEYKCKDYKFIGEGEWSDYGYYEQLAEETKRPLKVAT